MGSVRPRIIFDTSGGNKLLDDPDSKVLLDALRAAYFVRVTEAVVAELYATPNDANRRQRLIDLCIQLTYTGEIVLPIPELLVAYKKYFLQKGDAFEWLKVKIGCPRFRDMLARTPVSDGVSLAQQLQNLELEKSWKQTFLLMRPAFVKVLSEHGNTIPSLPEVMAAFRQNGGAMFNGWAVTLFADADDSTSEEALRSLYNSCPPFKSIVTALCVMHYAQCVMNTVGKKKEPSWCAGRVDTLTAIFLPMCDYFVGNDERQLRFFREVVVEAELTTVIESYKEFKNRLLLLPRPA
jgi:hypothetical protein